MLKRISKYESSLLNSYNDDLSSTAQYKNVEKILVDRLGILEVESKDDGFVVTIESNKFHLFGLFILDYPYSNDKKTIRITFTLDEKNNLASINTISQIYDRSETKKWINKIIDVAEDFCSKLKALD